MILKEENEIYMEPNEDEVQEEIQQRHKDGWMLVSHIGIHDNIFGPCIKLVFQRWSAGAAKVDPANPVIYGVPHSVGGENV